MGPFTWLRAKVRESVLAGISDALAEIDSTPDDTAAAALALRQRVQPQLPAADDEPEPAKKRRG